MRRKTYKLQRFVKFGRLYVSRTKSNVFLVVTDLKNKPVRVASAGMAMGKSRVTVRDKLLPKTIGIMVKAFAKFFLARRVTTLDVIFEYDTSKYFEVIMERLYEHNISVNNVFFRNGISFNGCKKRKSKRK